MTPYSGPTSPASAMEAGEAVDKRVREPTSASTWYAVSGGPITDELLEWPPDLFALTNVVLARAEAFRFALSPVEAWPPSRYRDWAHAVEEAGRRLERLGRGSNRRDARPGRRGVGRLPGACRDAARATGDRARLADVRGAADACMRSPTRPAPGSASPWTRSNADACVYRARGRELLARTGSLARIDARLLRVLPKVRTPPTGRPAFSRYACVHGPGIEARWHKIPARHRGTDLRSEYATLLLLPWPLRVRASDFHPVEGSRAEADEGPVWVLRVRPGRRP